MEASGRVYQPEGVDLSFIVERDVCACLFVCLLVFAIVVGFPLGPFSE